MLKFSNLSILVLGVSLGFLVSAGGSVVAQRWQQDTTVVNAHQHRITKKIKEKQDTPAVNANTFPHQELKTFTEVFGRIQRDYVEPVTDKKLLENAIRGMLAGLDPHSTYLNNEQYEELKVGTSGQFGGLGIKVTMENGFVKVVSPIDDTPAYHAGVQTGDLVVRLDDKPVKGLSLSEAVKIMRGEPKTNIVLTIIREGTNKPLKITITRDIIKVKSVKSRMLEKNYAYVRISTFKSSTAENLVEEITALKKSNKDILNGLVLDLRNNPGGVLNAATAVSDAFLEEGLIVYTEGRIKNTAMKFNATQGDLLEGAPIVVLINAGSASASEIVAGSLQDHKRAIIMGEKSFGKGSVQTILPVGNGAIKLTTARYYTPSGRSIQAEGIEPDITLARIRLKTIDNVGFKPIKESDLSHHLENSNKNDIKKLDNADKKTKQLPLNDDYPLNEALNLLKGINIFNKLKS